VKRVFLIIVLISLTGCAHSSTVKALVGSAEFQAENLPHRTVSVCVITEGSWPRQAIESTIGDVSSLMIEQVGIELKIESWTDHPIPSFTQGEGLKNLARIVGKSHRECDLVIGFSSRSVVSYLTEMALGAWLGAIDDNYRKFIIIKYLDNRILMHEICHAFVFTKSHSTGGVMTGAVIKIPLVPALFNLPRYVSIEDRQEILRNKWRHFNEKPTIPEDFQIDTIEPLPDVSSKAH
jgi:hypothetical protein